MNISFCLFSFRAGTGTFKARLLRAAGVSVLQLAFSLSLFGADPAVKYTLNLFDIPGAITTEIAGINISGEVVGTVSFDGQTTQGFIMLNENVTLFQVPGAVSTQAYGLNDSGVVVGSYTSENASPLGFIRNIDGTFTMISAPESTVTEAIGINNLGYVSGWCYLPTGGGQQDIFVYNQTAQTFETFSVPNKLVTDGFGINNNGDVVGFDFGVPEIPKGIELSSTGAISVVKIPGEEPRDYLYPFGINDTGAIVGYYLKHSTSVYSGFVLTPHGKLIFNSPNYIALGINNKYQIVGYYIDSSGALHGFLGNPSK